MATEQGLDPAFQAKIDAMVAASGGRLTIQSGYRDNALQAKLYNAAVQKYGEAQAGNWVAPPGHSNHNRGLAVDLGGDIGLAHQLAPQFGLEFPMSWEPWHIEPVGLREKSSPQAYTQGPAGSANPTQDATINSRPETLFARLADAMSTDYLGDPAKVGGVADGATDASGTLGPEGPQGPMGTVPLQSGALGGDKRVPGKSIQDWAKDVLTGLGTPTSQQNIDTLVTWANTESGGYNPNASGGRYNPLNTTEGAVGFVGQGGSQGNIKDFGSYDQGVQAIVHNLTKTKGVGYDKILAGLHAQDPQATFNAINQSAFGTHF